MTRPSGRFGRGPVTSALMGAAAVLLEEGLRRRVPFAYAVLSFPLWVVAAFGVGFLAFGSGPGYAAGWIAFFLVLCGGPMVTLYVAGRRLRK